MVVLRRGGQERENERERGCQWHEKPVGLYLVGFVDLDLEGLLLQSLDGDEHCGELSWEVSRRKEEGWTSTERMREKRTNGCSEESK